MLFSGEALLGDEWKLIPDSEKKKELFGSRLALGCCFLLGAGLLAGWNALITAADYFGAVMPGRSVELLLTVCYLPVCLLTLLACMAAQPAAAAAAAAAAAGKEERGREASAGFGSGSGSAAACSPFLYPCGSGKKGGLFFRQRRDEEVATDGGDSARSSRRRHSGDLAESWVQRSDNGDDDNGNEPSCRSHGRGEGEKAGQDCAGAPEEEKERLWRKAARPLLRGATTERETYGKGGPGGQHDDLTSLGGSVGSPSCRWRRFRSWMSGCCPGFPCSGLSLSGMDTRGRVLTGFVGFTVAMALVPLLDAINQRISPEGSGSGPVSHGSGWLLAGILAVSAAVGVFDGLCQGAVFAEVAPLPPAFTHAVVSGTASSGVIICALRIVTKLIAAAGGESLRLLRLSTQLYFGLAGLVCLACLLVRAVLLPRLPVWARHHHRHHDRQAPAARPQLRDPARRRRANNGDGEGRGPNDLPAFAFAEASAPPTQYGIVMRQPPDLSMGMGRRRPLNGLSYNGDMSTNNDGVMISNYHSYCDDGPCPAGVVTSANIGSNRGPGGVACEEEGEGRRHCSGDGPDPASGLGAGVSAGYRTTTSSHRRAVLTPMWSWPWPSSAGVFWGAGIRWREIGRAAVQAASRPFVAVVERCLPRGAVRCLRRVVKPCWALLTVYGTTLTVFPGVLVERIQSPSLGSWSATLVITLYNVGDLIGKSLPLPAKAMPPPALPDHDLASTAALSQNSIKHGRSTAQEPLSATAATAAECLCPGEYTTFADVVQMKTAALTSYARAVAAAFLPDQLRVVRLALLRLVVFFVLYGILLVFAVREAAAVEGSLGRRFSGAAESGGALLRSITNGSGGADAIWAAAAVLTFLFGLSNGYLTAWSLTMVSEQAAVWSHFDVRAMALGFRFQESEEEESAITLIPPALSPAPAGAAKSVVQSDLGHGSCLKSTTEEVAPEMYGGGVVGLGGREGNSTAPEDSPFQASSGPGGSNFPSWIRPRPGNGAIGEPLLSPTQSLLSTDGSKAPSDRILSFGSDDTAVKNAETLNLASLALLANAPGKEGVEQVSEEEEEEAQEEEEFEAEALEGLSEQIAVVFMMAGLNLGALLGTAAATLAR